MSDIKFGIDITASVDKSKRALNSLGKMSGSIAKKFGGFIKNIVTSKLSLVALTAAVGISIRDFAKLEQKVTDVVNLFAGGKEDVKQFTDQLIDLSTRVPQKVDDLAAALFDVVSAGVAVGESMEFLETASKLATSGVTDTKTAVDGLTSVMNAYSLEAKDATRISDIFFQSQVEGKTTIAELSQNIGVLAPVARSAGISIEEMFAAVTTLTKAGIKTDMAVTSLRGTINSIIKPTDEASKIAQTLGIDFSATALKAKGLRGVLEDIQDKTQGDTETISKLIPNVRALTGVLSLAGAQGEEFARIMGTVSDSSGVTEKAFKSQAETTAAQITIMKNSFRKLSNTIATALVPALNKAIPLINKLLGSKDTKKANPFKRAIEHTKEYGETIRKTADRSAAKLVGYYNELDELQEKTYGLWTLKEIQKDKDRTKYLYSAIKSTGLRYDAWKEMEAEWQAWYQKQQEKQEEEQEKTETTKKKITLREARTKNKEMIALAEKEFNDKKGLKGDELKNEKKVLNDKLKEAKTYYDDQIKLAQKNYNDNTPILYDAFNVTITGFSDMWDAAKDYFDSVEDASLDQVKTQQYLAKAMGEAWSGGWNHELNVFKNFVENVKYLGKQMVADYLDGLKMEVIASTAAGVARAVAAKDFVGAGIIATQGAIAVTAIDGAKASVMGLEQGGIVTGNGIYELGEKNKKEAVIPLERPESRQLLRDVAGGIGDQTINVQFNLDGQPLKTFTEKISNVQAEGRKQGRF